MFSAKDETIHPTQVESFTAALTANAEKVKIYIGEKTPASNPFEIPKALLIKHAYFNKALSSKWSEGQNNSLHFPEDSEQAWSVLIFYFLRNHVEWPGYDADRLCYRVYDAKRATHCEGDIEHASRSLLNLTHAFLLADKYGLIALQNKIIQAVMLGCELHREFFDATLAEFFTLIPPGCPLRLPIIENMIFDVEDCDEWREAVKWSVYEPMMKFEGVFTELMKRYESYHACPARFPQYRHLGLHDQRMLEYFVQEPKED